MIRLYFLAAAMIFLMGVGSLPLQAQEAPRQKKEELPPPPKVIIVDPGHGGKDPGALVKKAREKDIALAIAKKVGGVAKKRLAAKVVFTRSSDRFISLEERNRIANRNSCDFFVSVHVNAAASKKPEGIEVYYLNNATDRAAEKLAVRENAGAPKKMSDVQAILSGLIQNAATEDSAEAASYIRKGLQNRMTKKFGVKSVKVKTALFYVLVGTKCPSLLIETGFITNPRDEKRLKSASYQNALSEAVVEGMATYFQNLDHPRSDL